MLARSVLGLCCLLSLAPLHAQSPLEGSAAGPATDKIRRQLEKSVLVTNESARKWVIGLYANESDDPSGTITAQTYNRQNGTLTSKGEFSPTRSITLEPGEWVAITPTPGKTVVSRLGGKRPDLHRRISLEDGTGKKVNLDMRRVGGKDGEDKHPTIMFENLGDLSRLKKAVLLSSDGQENWLRIKADALP